MDFEQIKGMMKFFNWELIGAIAILTMAWVQWLKKWLPETWPIGKIKLPVVDLVAFASGFVFAHLFFNMSGIEHTETVAMFHGFAGTLFAILGYFLLSGKIFTLSSASELKNGKQDPVKP